MSESKEIREIIEDADLATEAKSSYLRYALMTVKSRALPQVEDGQKPVQKRILYAMYEMGLLGEGKTIKCAKVVGNVIGNYHPHGDMAVYEAMVHIAQPFSMRYPLVQGQGNFGSRDGAGAAASRYTECKLLPIAELLLSELKLGSVDFKPNYDNSDIEPVRLPARLPFVLLNGTSGIAVGMTCDLPSHNLNEVGRACIALMRNPKMSISDLLEIMPGPDFHGGATIVSNKHTLQNAYETGNGTIKVRGVWQVESMARGQWQLIIKELPPAVSAKKIMMDLADIVNPQPSKPGEKLTADQVSLRNLALGLIEEFRDESGKDDPVRIVIEPKTSKIDLELLLSFLYTRTSLEDTVKINFNVLNAEGLPIQMNLKDIFVNFIEFRKICVRKRTEKRISDIEARQHILTGRKLILVNVDKAIKIVRESLSPKEDLMAAFSLSEIQAEDVLEMRLRQLARIDDIKLDKEMDSLEKERVRLVKLREEKHLIPAIIAEMEADVAKYGDARRTAFDMAPTQYTSESLSKATEEEITVVLTKNGWLRTRPGKGLDLSTLQFKQGDSFETSVELLSTDRVVFTATDGRAYSLAGSDIPQSRGDGVLASSQFELAGSRLQGMFAGPDEATLILAGEQGCGFIAPLKSMKTKLKAGKTVLVLESGEKALMPVYKPTNSQDGYLACFSSDSKLLIFPLAELKEMEKAKGVMLMDLAENATLTRIVYCTNKELALNSGKSISGKTFEGYVLHRGRKGKPLK